MNILTHPKWQYPLREAQSVIGKSVWAEETVEAGIERMQGAKLHMVLRNFFSLPIPKGTVQRNYYTADGLWFRLKFAANDVAVDGNPLYEATTAVAGHHKAQGKASTTFTLYVGHVTPDESYDGWPPPRVLVARELGLYYTNYMPVQAELALLIDLVEADYREALPRFQAWQALAALPPDAAMQTDYLRQLVRQALRRMPAAEVLKALEPEVLPEADAADEAACLDGMQLPAPSEPVTLAALEIRAGNMISKIDEMLAEFGPVETDDDDDPDDDDTQHDFDDDTEPETPINVDAPGYEVQRIPHGTEINEADLNGIEFTYPVS